MSYVFAAVAGSQLMLAGQQAEMIEQNGRIKAKVDEMNAQFAEADAYDAEQMGFTEAARYQTVVDSTISDQRAGYAAQDVDVNYGTAKELQEESRFIGMLNAVDIKRQARNKALGFKREASAARLGASFTRSQASMDAQGARTAGLINAATTGVSKYNRK